MKDDRLKDFKMLYIQEGYFRLPDDFTGTKYDAMKLLSDYLPLHSGNAKVYDCEERTVWQAFANNYPHDKEKWAGSFAIAIYNDDNEREYLDEI